MRRTSVLLATLLLAACTGAPASVQPSATETTATAVATPSPTPAEPPTPTATPVPSPTELVLDQLGFAQLESGEGSEQDWRVGTVPTALVVGTLDGQVTATVGAGLSGDWGVLGTGPVLRWAAAPATGRVLWADGTQLHLVDVTSGEDRAVYEAPAPIDHGALSPDGSTAFVAQREAPANWSIWRIDLQGAADPELLRPALPEGVAATGIVLARTGEVFVRAAVAPDGATLAVEECGTLCRIWTMDLTSGAMRQYPTADYVGVWPLLAVVGDVVLDNRAFDLESGELSDGYCVPALQTDSTAVLVCHGNWETGTDQPGVEIIDPRTGASRRAPLEEGRELTVSHLADLRDAYPRVELPAGWVLVEEVQPNPDQDCNVWTLYAWNIDTGDLVPLPGVFLNLC